MSVDMLHPWLLEFESSTSSKERQELLVWLHSGQMANLLELFHSYRDGSVLVFHGVSGYGQVVEPAKLSALQMLALGVRGEQLLAKIPRSELCAQCGAKHPLGLEDEQGRCTLLPTVSELEQHGICACELNPTEAGLPVMCEVCRGRSAERARAALSKLR